MSKIYIFLYPPLRALINALKLPLDKFATINNRGRSLIAIYYYL